MSKNDYPRSSVLVPALALLVLVAGAPAGLAQTPVVSGAATALQASVTVLGQTTTTALGATGPLANDGDARNAALPTGSIASVGGANVLHATAVSAITNWIAGDSVASDAAVADLSLGVGGSAVTASFVMAQADTPLGGASTVRTAVEDLTVDGVPIAATGAENQTVSLPGLTLVLNQVQRTGGSITVTALRVTSADGLVDVAVASASSGIGP